jgi:hypothetical protein
MGGVLCAHHMCMQRRHVTRRVKLLQHAMLDGRHEMSALALPAAKCLPCRCLHSKDLTVAADSCRECRCMLQLAYLPTCKQ